MKLEERWYAPSVSVTVMGKDIEVGRDSSMSCTMHVLDRVNGVKGDELMGKFSYNFVKMLCPWALAFHTVEISTT